MHVWVLTDGKAGDEAQCIGVAEALGTIPTMRRIAPRAPWRWLMPRGWIDPREHPCHPQSPISPPFPDLLIASGRRAVPYLRLIKKLSGGKTFTVFLKDPRTGAGTADLIWVPEHDALRGDNVLRTLTSPHRVSGARLAEARLQPVPWPENLPRPWCAVLIGGDSKHYRYTPADVEMLRARLEALAHSGAALLVTFSRRTPLALKDAVRALSRRFPVWIWDETGNNPYISLLAHGECIVVTADSVNMVGEAVATGLPVLVFEPLKVGKKIAFFLQKLKENGIITVFDGLYRPYAYEALDSTPEIAKAIVNAMRKKHGSRRDSAILERKP